jgi:hypothetical protein
VILRRSGWFPEKRTPAGSAIHFAVLLAKIAVTLGVGLGAVSGAADAAAASLSVKVSPASLHPGLRYAVTITGSYTRPSGARPPYLLAFIQYGGSACESSATGEYALPTSRWTWVFYPQRAEPNARFKDVSDWKAGSRLGTRWVCAYLYTRPVTPATRARPLLRASASFTNARR